MRGETAETVTEKILARAGGWIWSVENPFPSLTMLPLISDVGASCAIGSQGFAIMDVHKSSLLAIFDAKQRLEVPLFQRQYVGTKNSNGYRFGKTLNASLRRR